MLFIEEICFREEFYSVLYREVDNLLMPLIEEHKTIWKSYAGDVIASYAITDYRLELEDLILDKNLMKDQELFLDREPVTDRITGNKVLEHLQHPLSYTGGIIVAREIVDTFHLSDGLSEYPCYCYKEVYELIFDQGALIMSIDHSKAMLRIRKNLEKGLRSLKSAKDIRTINKFLNQTFCKEYEKNRKLRFWKKKFYKMRHKISDNSSF